MTAARAALFAAFIVSCAPSSVAPASAVELESRLYAPCCDTQTLDIHESEIADALRKEIATRMARGESAEHIEDDLVARYGEKIVAVPRGRDPRRWIPLLTLGAMLSSGALLLAVLRRWTRRASAPARPNGSPTRDEYDDRLDAALAEPDETRAKEG